MYEFVGGKKCSGSKDREGKKMDKDTENGKSEMEK